MGCCPNSRAGVRIVGKNTPLPNQQMIGEISAFRDYILQERAHFPPILNKFIYYLNKISEFCPQNLSAKSWQNFGTLEFRYFVKVVNKLIQNRWETCPFLGALEIGGLSEQKMEAFLTVTWWLGTDLLPLQLPGVEPLRGHPPPVALQALQPPVPGTVNHVKPARKRNEQVHRSNPTNMSLGHWRGV